MIGVVDLAFAGHIDADGEVIESDIFNSFGRWIEGDDAQRSGTLYESLRSERRTDTAHWLADLICIRSGS